MSTYFNVSGIKSSEPLPGPFYGQRILGVYPQGNSSGDNNQGDGPNVGVHIHYNPSEFLPGGRPDPQGRRNLNEEHQRQREMMEAIMEKEMELEQMKKQLVEHISSAK